MRTANATKERIKVISCNGKLGLNHLIMESLTVKNASAPDKQRMPLLLLVKMTLNLSEWS
ncbi:MAG: hypothetical protein ACI8XC_002692 [Gammaproteobacteria bacterium]|jgi:hypothetical protein